MTRCDHCGTECTLPFTCQHCGGKFCADCRLPPNHSCTGITRWNRKPRPAVGANHTRGGVSSTGGIVSESRRSTVKSEREGLPYFWIMAAIITLILLGLAWLVLSGH